MSIKFRRPQAGEERLSWCKGLDVKIAGEDGLMAGTIDVQFVVLSLDEYQDLMRDMRDDEAGAEMDVRSFLESVVRGVKGFKDDDGEWPSEDQIEFVCNSADCALSLFSEYPNHVFGGKLGELISGRLPAQRTRKRRK